MFAFGIFSSLVLVSCGSVVLVSCGSKSGQRVPAKSIRVREVGSRTVNFIRLNSVEQGIYRVGDTVKMNGTTHSIVYGVEDIVSASGMIKTVILEK